MCVGNPTGIPMGMDMGTVMNRRGSVGILWRFLTGREIKWKRVEHAINVVVAVWTSPNTVQFTIFVLRAFCSNIITDYT